MLEETMGNEGLAAALGKYAGMIARPGDFVLEEGEMNGLGYELLQEGNTNDATGISRLNAGAFPKSWNVYDSLGEAYAADGENEPAISNCERSLRLNPSNTGAVEALEKLKASSQK